MWKLRLDRRVSGLSLPGVPACPGPRGPRLSLPRALLRVRRDLRRDSQGAVVDLRCFRRPLASARGIPAEGWLGTASAPVRRRSPRCALGPCQQGPERERPRSAPLGQRRAGTGGPGRRRKGGRVPRERWHRRNPCGLLARRHRRAEIGRHERHTGARRRRVGGQGQTGPERQPPRRYGNDARQLHAWRRAVVLSGAWKPMACPKGPTRPTLRASA